jgi:hypothetical protein
MSKDKPEKTRVENYKTEDLEKYDKEFLIKIIRYLEGPGSIIAFQKSIDKNLKELDKKLREEANKKLQTQ